MARPFIPSLGASCKLVADCPSDLDPGRLGSIPHKTGRMNFVDEIDEMPLLLPQVHSLMSDTGQEVTDVMKPERPAACRGS